MKKILSLITGNTRTVNCQLSIVNCQNGYIVLLTTIVITSIATTIVTSLLLMSLGSSKVSFSVEQMIGAKALAHACGETALQQIRDNQNFTGSGNLTLTTGTCNYTVTNLGGNDRSIEADGTAQNHTQRIEILIDGVKPQIDVTSLTEVASF